jgi:protein-tyrosine phosphatase
LTGAINFRDIGGYRSGSGRALKRGLLFRSDSLAELSDADQATVHSLALRSVIDLRHDSERHQRPNRLPPQSSPRTHAIGFFPHGSQALMSGVRDRSLSQSEARHLLLEMYRRMPVDQAPTYARMLQIVLQPDALPCLIHCTSGKDRTGFGVAVVMLSLDVPRELILEDYLLTNHYRRDLTFMLGTDVDPGVLDVVKAADPEFLQAAFDVIDRQCGGTQHFLRQHLGLTGRDQSRLQDLLLEA